MYNNNLVILKVYNKDNMCILCIHCQFRYMGRSESNIGSIYMYVSFLYM